MENMILMNFALRESTGNINSMLPAKTVQYQSGQATEV